MKRAFTLIELLVVIAIIAILAAILFPVFAQAKEAAKKTQCLSNHKNLALAGIMYVGEHDDTYPYQHEMYFDAAGEFKQNAWSNAFFPYIKNGATKANTFDGAGNNGVGGIFSCPTAPNPKENFQYGVHGKISPDGYMFWKDGGSITATNPPPAVSQSRISESASTIYIVEKGKNNHASASDPWGFTGWETDEWAWTDTVMVNGVPTRQNKRYDLDYDCDKPTYDDKWDGWPTCSAMPRYRHNRASNVSFIDGHAKSMNKGQIDWYKNVYVEGLHGELF